jgi:hypothetical protein
MHQVFTSDDRREKALTRENARLKNIIGGLTVELKKVNELLARGVENQHW